MTQERISLISDRKDRIATRLANSFECTASTLYVGSYGRGTSNYKTSDIDMIFKFPWNIHDQYDAHKTNGQSHFLQAVKNSIAITYPQTNLKGDGQIVSVKFSDDMIIEILPAFEYVDGSFRYPDSNNGGSWKRTYPREEIKALDEMNDTTNGNLKNLCRMTRQWRHHHGLYLKGAIIDIFCYNFIKDYKYKQNSYTYYDYMIRDFFEYLEKDVDFYQTKFKMPGSNRMIDKGTAVYYTQAGKSYKTALELVSDYAENRPYCAKANLREIYGITIQ